MVVAGCAALLSLLIGVMPVAAQEVSGVEHWVEHAGLKLYVWEKYVGSPVGKPIVVLAHGSGTAGRESFDLQVPEKPSYSLMDVLAREGFDVFAPDMRGFGRSTRPAGYMTTQEASTDLRAAVEYILRLRNSRQIHLLAWSWGTQYGGMFVAAHPDMVARYVSYAQMHAESPDLVQRQARLETFEKAPYLSIPEAGWKRRFTSMTPATATEPEVVETFARAAARIEKKTPTGPQIDMATIMPMLDPHSITVPTMLIHGQYDDVADLDGLLPFFRLLPNPGKRYVVIPNAGHMMHLQSGHRAFQHEVVSFFKAP